MSTTVSDAASIETRNPATGEVLKRYPAHDPTAVGKALDEAVAAQRRWRATSMDERGAHLRAAARVLRERKAEWAGLATAEMGKPIAEAEAEVEKCAVGCDWFADNGARLLADEQTPSSATRSYVAFRPLGVLLAIMPWNFPYWQAFRAAAPALMAGNTIVLKHASNVSGCALAIEEIFRSAGLAGRGVHHAAGGQQGDGPDRRRRADRGRHPDRQRGAPARRSARPPARPSRRPSSSWAGATISSCWPMPTSTRRPRSAVKARFQNTGQSCIAAKRFIVEERVYDRYAELFVQHARALRVGDPTARDTRIGPMARARPARRAGPAGRRHRARRRHAAAGRQGCATGAGAFYEPTVVGEVVPGMRMADEETFGPAAALMRARDAEHALELANDCRYGLGGNLWTRDIARAEALAARLESGNVFVNGMTASDPRLPFGGVKKSGYGRELAGFGIREFVNVQTVWIGPDTGAGAGSAAPAE